MTDLHLLILRMIAKHRQSALDDHDAAGHTQSRASAGRRRDLEKAARRTEANVAAAQARRPRPGRADQ
jgi:hypothetical protein